MTKKLIALILLAVQGSVIATDAVVHANSNDACCITKRPVCCGHRRSRTNCSPRRYRGRRWRNNDRRTSRRARGWNNKGCCGNRRRGRVRNWFSNCCPRPRRRRACCNRRRHCRPKPACCPTNGNNNGETVVEEAVAPVEEAVEVVV